MLLCMTTSKTHLLGYNSSLEIVTVFVAVIFYSQSLPCKFYVTSFRDWPISVLLAIETFLLFTNHKKV